MNIATVGLDIAKQFFQVHGVDPTGQVVLICPPAPLTGSFDMRNS